MTDESKREYFRKYYLEHRERMKESSNKWRKEHRERIKGHNAAYYERHRDELLAKCKTRNRAKREAMTPEERDECRKKCLDAYHAHRDRIAGRIKERRQNDAGYAMKLRENAQISYYKGKALAALEGSGMRNSVKFARAVECMRTYAVNRLSRREMWRQLVYEGYDKTTAMAAILEGGGGCTTC